MEEARLALWINRFPGPNSNMMVEVSFLWGCLPPSSFPASVVSLLSALAAPDTLESLSHLYVSYGGLAPFVPASFCPRTWNKHNHHMKASLTENPEILWLWAESGYLNVPLLGVNTCHLLYPVPAFLHTLWLHFCLPEVFELMSGDQTIFTKNYLPIYPQNSIKGTFSKLSSNATIWRVYIALALPSLNLHLKYTEFCFMLHLNQKCDCGVGLGKQSMKMSVSFFLQFLLFFASGNRLCYN